MTASPFALRRVTDAVLRSTDFVVFASIETVPLAKFTVVSSVSAASNLIAEVWAFP